MMFTNDNLSFCRMNLKICKTKLHKKRRQGHVVKIKWDYYWNFVIQTLLELDN